MSNYPPAMQKLIRELTRLPTIGERSAIRLAYYLVSGNRDHANSLSKTIQDSVSAIQLCEQCFFLSEGPRCSICLNSSRDPTLLCVVEKPSDVIAIERMQEYRGYYHVLHGLWAPLKGQGPEVMRLAELLARVKDGPVKEVILATSSTVEGDATALYVARHMSSMGVTITRPAQGIPKGAELEYADDLTLSRAFSGRGVINS